MRTTQTRGGMFVRLGADNVSRPHRHRWQSLGDGRSTHDARECSVCLTVQEKQRGRWVRVK